MDTSTIATLAVSIHADESANTTAGSIPPGTARPRRNFLGNKHGSPYHSKTVVASTPGRLSPEALPNVAPCFRLRCAAICEKCGESQACGHCPTVAFGFRCDACCEVCNPALAEKTA
jgi:hypothetical protein